MQKPRHIALTGASSGIGAALAVAYAEPGIRISLHGRNESRLNWVKAQVHAKGATVDISISDVTDQAGMAAWVQSCDARQPIDLLIANAGISPGLKTGHESAQDVRSVFAVNLTGVMNTVQPAISLMRQRKHGQIALMSSLASFRGFSGGASYCASKAAVRVYGEALRGDLAINGIAVSVICPGFVTTPMTDANPFPMPMRMDADKAAQIIKYGLTKDIPRIAFPLTMYALVRFVSLLPQDLIDKLAAFLRKKP